MWRAGSDDTFVDLFRTRAASNLAATAVAAGSRLVTYAELQRMSTRMASALWVRGARPETIIGVQLDRSLDLLLCLLGILRCAAAYLPLGPDDPPARTARILETSRCSMTLTSAGHAPRLEAALAGTGRGPWPPIVRIEELLAATDGAGTQAARPGPANLAYVIYTSGSTGMPKGAMVEHCGLLNHLLAKIHELAISPADCVVQNAPQVFDISVWQLLAPLLAGGRVMLLPAERAERPWSLLADVVSGNATVLEVVPAMLSSILDWLEGSHPGVALPICAG